jgi:type IV pilus assembly protein PilQ
MRRFGLPLIAIGLATLGIVRAGVVLAESPAAGVRLRAISSTLDNRRAALVLEASEPVAYTASRPDPFSLVLELRNVTSAGYANGFRSEKNSPIQSVSVEETRASDGAPVTRISLAFTEPLTPKVRSQRNLIFVEADAAELSDEPAALTDAAPPVDEERRPVTVLRTVAARTDTDGVSVILEATGRLVPDNIEQPGSHRLVLDFVDVKPAVPSVTAVGRGPVERVRVALHANKPLTTRVVVDLARRVTHRVEPLTPEGRGLRIVFANDGDAVASPAAHATSGIVPVEAAMVAAQAPVASAIAEETAPASDSTAAMPRSAAKPPTLSPGAQDTFSRSGEKSFSGHPVSLDFQGADLRAVLRTFAEISGLNIVIDPAVQGSVDVALRDVPWDQALDIILRANKLGYFVDGTIVRVAPLSVLADEEKQRRKLAEEQALSGELRVLTKTLSYARAEEVAPLLTKSALSPRGSVQVDARTNTLIISDLQPQLDTASTLIATLDQPQPQVEIEARIVQTTRDFARTIGVQWGMSGRMTPELGNTTGLAFPNRGSVGGRVGDVQGPEGTPTTVNLGVGAASSAIGLALGAINGAFNLDVALSALERQGQGKLLSTPRVSTQNNVEAEITQGVQIPIQTVANNTVTVSFKDAALTLKVTPQITSANTVIMKITVENASPDFSRAVGESQIPPIDTQRAITQVLVQDGQTTVIGGIYVSREQAVIDRTPALHRIPLLGWLFKRNGIQDESRELLIFITPRILRS